MDVKLIDEKKRRGDFPTVAKMLGLTDESVRQAWYRKNGKTFEKVKTALEKVIEVRERLINKNK